MTPSSLPWARTLRATVFSAGPPAVALLVLTGLGKIAPGTAFVSLVGVVGGLFALNLVRTSELERLRRHIERLVRGAPSKTPGFAVSATARDLGYALDRLWRTLLERSEKAEAAQLAIERVLDRLPEPLLVVEPRGRIARANAAAKELFGQGIEGHDLAAALRNPAVLEALEEARRSRAPRSVEFAAGQPLERSFVARIEPQASSGEAEPATILLLNDITAIKHSERMRADFVANASHEIRTPLASLVGFIETLRGPARDDPAARERFLETMEQQAARMARLVDDLLSLSRIEMREHTPPTGRVRLPDLLKSVCVNLEWQAKERGVRLALEAAPDLPPVLGEAAELAQVFHNLVSNAIKYGRSEGTVTIEARRATMPAAPGGRREGDEAVAVAVVDEGEGIPREHIPRLTERFYRVDTARSRELGGTGLGLAIVKHIVNRHRGVLAIESTLGVGSRFTVYLRSAAEAAA